MARAAARLGGAERDFERWQPRWPRVIPWSNTSSGHCPAAAGADDLYAESAAEFLTTHLLTQGRHERLPGPEHAAVRVGIAVMHDRLAEPLTLADIAAEAHLSVYHFVRVFRAATGETPHRYLTRLRIQRARRLLTDSDLTIGQIATRCGFASPGALSTAFLGHVGVRPSVYRKI